MSVQAKLSSEERRAAIIKAVRQVFAQKGFHGTTSRALAEASGVSEALLFKHFPNKEALYSAMQVSCCNEQQHSKFERAKALEPSTSTLVLMVHLMVTKMVGKPSGSDDHAIHHRLMLRSLAEDGEFARLFLQRISSGWIQKMEECIKTGISAGEVTGGRVQPRLGAWFAHHLPILVMSHLSPPNPVVDYGVRRETLIEQVVWFTLRGIGLKDEAIQRYYNPKALALLEG
jgi:AcrR family transcriptional regulator